MSGENDEENTVFEEAVRASQEFLNLLRRTIALNNLIEVTQQRKIEIAMDTTMDTTMRDIEFERLCGIEEELTCKRDKQHGEATTPMPSPALSSLKISDASPVWGHFLSGGLLACKIINLFCEEAQLACRLVIYHLVYASYTQTVVWTDCAISHQDTQ